MKAPMELAKQVEAYLAVREAVGLTNKGLSRLLGKFVAYAQADGSPIRTTTAVAWAWDNAPTTCGVRGRSDRLMVVRGFLSYLATVVPGTEVPPSRIVAGATRRRPYIFTEEEMAALISAAARPNRRVPFRPTVLSTLLALLISTGLRVGEAVRLVTSNVRLGDAYPHLEILQTKFQKSRLVPILRPAVAIALGMGLTWSGDANTPVTDGAIGCSLVEPGRSPA